MGKKEKKSIEESTAADLKKKAKKEKKEEGKKRKREDSDEGTKKKKEKKSKDSKEKKDKKNKRKHACEEGEERKDAPAVAAGTAAVEEEQVETSKKQPMPETIQKVLETPKKKEQQPKKEGEQSQGGWNNWSKATFGGDASKQDKFMRLLGAKKGGKNDSTSSTSGNGSESKKKSLYGSLKSAIDEDENQRITNDLEKQFRSGIHFRQSNRRGGLGS
ncbi:small acidic protein family-domain-containing protein [Syncephalastrum racemosum]|uniref:Small acidic protein n=1 Tax=Syncephalastrum racemosum TaxID=13706 RepID=A0A1X2H3A7_SYNRA|nr:small acidic protein family-domain-containing protein [Syncephalastrum racemosum]